MRQLQIGNHLIQDEAPPFVIAEIGHNHQGNIESAISLIRAAADAVRDAAVIAADASSVLPANELKGAWENELMPNIYCSLFVCWFWRIAFV